MSTTRNVILSIIFFILFVFLCGVIFNAQESTTLGWVIAIVLSLAGAVGLYFLFGILQKRSLANQQKNAMAALQPFLPAGETLQMFVRGYVGPGQTGMILLFGALGDAIINAPRRQWYYVGLTQRYLVIAQVKGQKPTGVKQVLLRNEVKDLRYDTGALKEPRLVIEFAAEKMELRMMDYGMLKSAKAMDDTWHGNV